MSSLRGTPDVRRLRVALLAVVAGWQSSPIQSADPERPNVVLIVSDAQSLGDFGSTGNEQVQTPNLDRLASRSTLFRNGYVPTSVCRPSLATILTGQYPHRHGVHFNHPPPGFAALTKSEEMTRTEYERLRGRADRLIATAPSLPRILAEHGYRSLQTGKFWEGHSLFYRESDPGESTNLHPGEPEIAEQLSALLDQSRRGRGFPARTRPRGRGRGPAVSGSRASSPAPCPWRRCR